MLRILKPYDGGGRVGDVVVIVLKTNAKVDANVKGHCLARPGGDPRGPPWGRYPGDPGTAGEAREYRGSCETRRHGDGNAP